MKGGCVKENKLTYKWKGEGGLRSIPRHRQKHPALLRAWKEYIWRKKGKSRTEQGGRRIISRWEMCAFCGKRKKASDPGGQTTNLKERGKRRRSGDGGESEKGQKRGAGETAVGFKRKSERVLERGDCSRMWKHFVTGHKR